MLRSLLRQGPATLLLPSIYLLWIESTGPVLKAVAGVAARRRGTIALRVGFVLHESNAAGGLGPAAKILPVGRPARDTRSMAPVVRTGSYPKHSGWLAARSESRPGVFVTADLALHHRSCVGVFGNLQCRVENGLYGHLLSPSP